MAKRRFSYPRVKLVQNVIVGRGCVRTALDDFSDMSVALLASSNSAVNAVLDQAFADFSGEITRICKPAGEPTAVGVAEAGVILTASMPNVIVAVGGGSVLDWARLSWAAAAGSFNPYAPAEGLKEQPPVRPKFVLVPTTCATGAESATVAVIAHEGCKVPVVSDAFLASHVYLDSQFLEPLDHAYIALFLCDAVSHAIEAYASIVPNRIAKEMAISGLRLIRQGLADADSYTRENLMVGAFYAGAAASHCSVGVAHAFAHTAARHGLTHAHGNALALRATVSRLIAAGKLHGLVAGAGFNSAIELEDWIAQLVVDGLAVTECEALKAALADTTDLAAFVATMKNDVCLRSFPIRMSASDVAAFVGDTISAA